MQGFAKTLYTETPLLFQTAFNGGTESEITAEIEDMLTEYMELSGLDLAGIQSKEERGSIMGYIVDQAVNKNYPFESDELTSNYHSK